MSRLEELRARARAASANHPEVIANAQNNSSITEQPAVLLSTSSSSSNSSIPSGDSLDLVDPIITSSSNVIPNIGSAVELTSQQFLVFEKIEQLKLKLLTADPMMPVLLKQIHQAISKDPELIHFLSPEQVGNIVKGCMMQTKIVVVAAAVKKATGPSSKKLAQTTLDDI